MSAETSVGRRNEALAIDQQFYESHGNPHAIAAMAICDVQNQNVTEDDDRHALGVLGDAYSRAEAKMNESCYGGFWGSIINLFSPTCRRAKERLARVRELVDDKDKRSALIKKQKVKLCFIEQSK